MVQEIGSVYKSISREYFGRSIHNRSSPPPAHLPLIILPQLDISSESGHRIPQIHHQNDHQLVSVLNLPDKSVLDLSVESEYSRP